VIKIGEWAEGQGVPLFEAFGRVGEIEGIAEGTRTKVLAFHQLLSEEVERFRRRPSMAEAVRELFRRLGIEDELHRTIENPNVARRKVENVAEIVNSLAAFEERADCPTLSAYLEKVSLADEDRAQDRENRDPRGDAVTLMSLHSSKGLEFPCVFLVGLEEEILPHQKSIHEDFSIDEERRLCYVGITRARRYLTITRCRERKKYGKLQERVPSRFLEEIPENLLNCQEAGTKVATEEEADRMAHDFFARMKAKLGA
jgi:superfamily I DNA/RNA helicase